jgi:opacity protein-like surface antigen
MPITNSGASNLMFSFGGLSTMTAAPFLNPLNTNGGAGGTSGTLIPTYGVGYRYYISNNMALRATLGIVLNNSTVKASASGFSDSTDDKTAFGIGLGLQWNMPHIASVSPYWGVELGFLTGSDNTTSSAPSGTSAGTFKTSGSTFGVSVHAGAEWFFNSAMSLGAEYRFGFISSSGTITSQPQGSSTSTSTDSPSLTAIGTSAVSVILNVYIGK